MPTVSSTIRQTEMFGDLSHKLFRLDAAAADKSVLVGGAIETNASFLQSEFGGQPALTTVVENYTKEKSAFRSEIRDAISNLQKSAEQLKNSVQSEGGISREVSSAKESGETVSNVDVSTQSAKNNVVSQEKNISVRAESSQNQHEQTRQSAKTEDNFQKFAENYLVSDEIEDDSEQENSTSQTENQDDRLASVQNFVRDYNNAVSYLNKNNLSSLNQNDELTQSLNEIGISVNSSGKLFVDEKTLSEALQNNSDKVNSTLSNNGLTGQLDKDFARLNQQSENLFPTIVDYANQQEKNLSESLYSARNMTTAAYYGINAGALINTFT